MTNDGIAAQDGCTGIYDYVIFQRRMALPFSIFFVHTQCPKRNPLVQLYMVSNDRRFADHNTRTVIDAKVFSYRSAGMDINTCLTMGMFGDDARNTLNAQQMKFVGDAVRGYRIEPRIRLDNLTPAFCRRIAFVHGGYILLNFFEGSR